MRHPLLHPDHEPALRVAIIADEDDHSERLSAALEARAFSPVVLDRDEHLGDLDPLSREPFTQICIVDLDNLPSRPDARQLCLDLRRLHPGVPLVVTLDPRHGHGMYPDLPFQPDAQLSKSSQGDEIIDALGEAVSNNLVDRLRRELAQNAVACPV